MRLKTDIFIPYRLDPLSSHIALRFKWRPGHRVIVYYFLSCSWELTANISSADWVYKAIFLFTTLLYSLNENTIPKNIPSVQSDCQHAPQITRGRHLRHGFPHLQCAFVLLIGAYVMASLRNQRVRSVWTTWVGVMTSSLNLFVF